jgi:hypothetical protein
MSQLNGISRDIQDNIKIVCEIKTNLYTYDYG